MTQETPGGRQAVESEQGREGTEHNEAMVDVGSGRQRFESLEHGRGCLGGVTPPALHHGALDCGPLVRALGYTDDGGGDLFIDDDDSVFEGDIDRLGTAGVTRGCNPPTNDRFCPTDNVTREQMAAFLRRALDG